MTIPRALANAHPASASLDAIEELSGLTGPLDHRQGLYVAYALGCAVTAMGKPDADIFRIADALRKELEQYGIATPIAKELVRPLVEGFIPSEDKGWKR